MSLRIEIHFPDPAPVVCLPTLVQKTWGPVIMAVAEDSPLLRSKLTELMLSHPTATLVVSSCSVGRSAESASPHEMVRLLLDGEAQEPLSYNVKTAAKRLGISYSHLRELIHLGVVRKVNGRVSAAELQRYLVGKRIPAVSR